MEQQGPHATGERRAELCDALRANIPGLVVDDMVVDMIHDHYMIWLINVNELMVIVWLYCWMVTLW